MTHVFAERSRLVRVDQLLPLRKLTAQEMINILLKMGYELKKIDRGAVG